MSSAAGDKLNYQLFTGASRTQVWGDGTSSSSVMSGTGTGALNEETIYARVPKGQSSVRLWQLLRVSWLAPDTRKVVESLTALLERCCPCSLLVNAGQGAQRLGQRRDVNS